MRHQSQLCTCIGHDCSDPDQTMRHKSPIPSSRRRHRPGGTSTVARMAVRVGLEVDLLAVS